MNKLNNCLMEKLIAFPAKCPEFSKNKVMPVEKELCTRQDDKLRGKKVPLRPRTAGVTLYV